MGGVHETMKTTTWEAAWARIARQVYLRKRRAAGSWDDALEELARQSRRDAWAEALQRLARQARKHRDSHTEWHRALESLRKSDSNRRRRRGG